MLSATQLGKGIFAKRACAANLGYKALRAYSLLPLDLKLKIPNGIEYKQPTGLFINNEFVPSASGKTFEVISPSDEEIIGSVYESDAQDVDIAVQAAYNAFENSPWNKVDPSERGLALLKIADIIDQNAEVLTSIEAWDNGKSVSNAAGDIAFCAAYFRSAAGFADKISGNILETGDDFFTYTRKEPIGVVGQIIPWNFPLMMFSWKVAPALVCGNTVVLKTSETTPLSALYLASLIRENDVLPPGVLNVISGFGAVTGNAIAEHPEIRKVAFTGSTNTGKAILKKAAETNLKKVTLELGGKSPHIVFKDADLDVALQSTLVGIYANSGEVCCAGSRLYVQEDIYDQFLEKLKKGAESMVKVGNPFDPSVMQGAQNSEKQLEKILGYVDIGQKEGATLVTGGERLPGKGYFVGPTIFADTDGQMRIVREEIFGPVISVCKFKTTDEVVKYANDTEYGLAAGIQTSNYNRAIDVARRLKAGTVWHNIYNSNHPMAPFGGYNQSGIGRELGFEALENYLQTKCVRSTVSKPTD